MPTEVKDEITNHKQKVRQEELPALAGKLGFLKGMVGIEREVDGQKSYDVISKTMEEAINNCSEIADRLLYAGLEREVEVNLKTLQVARYGRWLPRDIARARIVEAVIESLNIEDRARLAEYESRENPCEEER